MNFTKKFDRAFQWAGEKMGSEAQTATTEDFKALEVEVALRHKGMEKLQRCMNTYVKWLSSKGDAFGPDKDKGLPVAALGRTMVAHGEDFDNDSEFGACLMTMGQANERLGTLQDNYTASATTHWLESLERSLAMMKEYQSARKKLESRRLAYDASLGKINKAKREDFRIEEELRSSKAKYEESSEDVLRRMQDIKESERETSDDMRMFLESELEYHERCADELRKARAAWPGASDGPPRSNGAARAQRTAFVSRTNTNTTSASGLSRTNSNYDDEPEGGGGARLATIRSTPSRVSLRSVSSSGAPDLPPGRPTPPTLSRTSTYQSEQRRPAPTPPPVMSNAAALRGQLRPVNPPSARGGGDDTSSSSPVSAGGSPDGEGSHYGYGSGLTSGGYSASQQQLYKTGSRTGASPSVNANGAPLMEKKKPPPPPPSRSKKPPPPVPARRPDMY